MRLMVLRFLCVFSLSIWVGGFTFYSAVVIPVLHETFGSLDTGYVTQRETHYLNPKFQTIFRHKSFLRKWLTSISTRKCSH
jgi:hypothetical protein